MTIDELLNQEPTPEEISDKGDGVRFLCIDVVRNKADKIFTKWETTDFNHFVFKHNNDTFASGSLNVKIHITKHELKNQAASTTFFTRNLAGAATIKLSDYPLNQHFAAILKSLCIVNALSNEYPAFGKNLNENIKWLQPEQTASKTKPEAGMIEVKKIEKAIKMANAELIHELLLHYHFGDQQLEFEAAYKSLTTY